MACFAFNRLASLAVVGVCLVGLSACGPGERQVTRVDPETTVDLDYRFNDTDARETYRAMVDDAMFRNWISRFQEANSGRKPVVIVGPVRNDTQEYIDTKLFTTEWERELLNSDRVRFVAMRDQRGDLRDEREQGQEWNSPETRKQMRNELGADLMLIGRIADVNERSLSGRQRMKYYKINLELANIETNEKVWIGSHEIKKLVRNP
jgi:penicillin-binding protein activator